MLRRGLRHPAPATSPSRPEDATCTFFKRGQLPGRSVARDLLLRRRRRTAPALSHSASCGRLFGVAGKKRKKKRHKWSAAFSFDRRACATGRFDHWGTAGEAGAPVRMFVLASVVVSCFQRLPGAAVDGPCPSTLGIRLGGGSVRTGPGSVSRDIFLALCAKELF